MKWPKLSPLFLLPGPSTLALSVGKPIDPNRYQGMSREAMLEDLRQALISQKIEAEKLRRLLDMWAECAACLSDDHSV